MSETNTIPKGSIIALTSGEYSGWGVYGIVEVLVDLELCKLRAAWAKAERKLSVDEWFDSLVAIGYLKRLPPLVSMWAGRDYDWDNPLPNGYCKETAKINIETLG